MHKLFTAIYEIKISNNRITNNSNIDHENKTRTNLPNYC